MKFSDIDFNAISNLMNSLSDEEKSRLGDMAKDMMGQYQKPQEEEEEVSIFEFYSLSEEVFNVYPGTFLDDLERAMDMETYYDEDLEQDYSASVLYLNKAVLDLLRRNIAPVFAQILNFSDFKNPANTTLATYFQVLMNIENIDLLNQSSSEWDWDTIRQGLVQVYTFLNRAEFDRISYNDLQVLKNLLFEENWIITIGEKSH